MCLHAPKHLIRNLTKGVIRLEGAQGHRRGTEYWEHMWAESGKWLDTWGYNYKMNKAVTIILSVSEMLGSSLHTCMMKKTDQGQLLNIHLNSSNFLFLFTNNSSFFSLQCYALIPVTASYRHTFLSSGTCTLVKTVNPSISGSLRKMFFNIQSTSHCRFAKWQTQWRRLWRGRKIAWGWRSKERSKEINNFFFRG